MNKVLGLLLMLISAALSLYAVYLLAGNGWAMLAGAFVIYCGGYHMMTSKRRRQLIAGEAIAKSVLCKIGDDGRVYVVKGDSGTAEVSFVRHAHDEVARKRGMN